MNERNISNKSNEIENLPNEELVDSLGHEVDDLLNKIKKLDPEMLKETTIKMMQVFSREGLFIGAGFATLLSLIGTIYAGAKTAEMWNYPMDEYGNSPSVPWFAVTALGVIMVFVSAWGSDAAYKRGYPKRLGIIQDLFYKIRNNFN